MHSEYDSAESIADSDFEDGELQKNDGGKNTKLNLSIIVSVCFSKQIYKQKSKDWRCRSHNTDVLNLDENKFVYKKNYL